MKDDFKTRFLVGLAAGTAAALFLVLLMTVIFLP